MLAPLTRPTLSLWKELFLAALLVLFIDSSLISLTEEPPFSGPVSPLPSAESISCHLPFISNGGQCPAAVAYYARTFGGTVYVNQAGDLVYALTGRLPGQAIQHWSLREGWVASKRPSIRAMHPARTKVNCFKGKSPSQWKTGLPTCEILDLGEVFEGITLRLRATSNNLEKIFEVAPHGDPQEIRIRLEGGISLGVHEAGMLVVKTPLGEVSFTAPLAYQNREGGRQYVEAAYWVEGNEYGFTLGDYDPQQALIIDPLLASTFIGGAADDRALKVVTDQAGYVYVAGYTQSALYPATPGAVDDSFNGGGYDAFITKMSPDLTTVVASTFLGGSADEGNFYLAMEFNEAGDLYVMGNTSSEFDFPTTAGAYSRTYGGGTPGPYGTGGDLFVCKLDATLSVLHASTFLGGSGHEYARAMAFDSQGRLYLAGATSSSDFPVPPGACQGTNAGGRDLFVARMDPALSSLQAATFFGGIGDDYAEAVCLDSAGRVFVTGWTMSQDYPTTPGALQEIYGGHFYDAMVTRFNSDLTAYEASTYLGGNSWDFGYAMVLDAQGHPYVTGHTASNSGFPTTPGAYSETYNSTLGPGNGDDIFITRLDPDLAVAVASTYLGDERWEHATHLALDHKGGIYITGSSTSKNYPISPDAFDKIWNGGHDVVITRMDTALTTIQASTFLGGAGVDGGYSTTLAFGPGGTVYVAGYTEASSFPVTLGAYGPAYHGGDSDVFLSRLDENLLPDPLAADAHKISASTGGIVNFSFFAGLANAHRHYILLATLSGTTPGLPLPGGLATLPLNWDGLTDLSLAMTNSAFYENFSGVLDGEGRGWAKLDSLGPIPPVFVNTVIHFAYIPLYYPWDFASNPLKVRIAP